MNLMCLIKTHTELLLVIFKFHSVLLGKISRSMDRKKKKILKFPS